MTYRTRFAPSPTGPLHLGHAYSALTAFDRARANGGEFLLRIEDIDRARSKSAFEAQIFDDLTWLGLSWPHPVLRQSTRLAAYRAALDQLIALGLCYPCQCSRGDIRAVLSAPQEGAKHGPDGLIYPGTCRSRPMSGATETDSIRLNMRAAIDHLSTEPRFTETGPLHQGIHHITAQNMIETVGDVVLARRDMGTAYHLSVTVDDAHQNITEVVRGIDLFDATRIHVLLQSLLQLPVPDYHHHDLIRDDHGKRLAKRDDARAIAKYRADGVTPQDIRKMVSP